MREQMQYTNYLIHLCKCVVEGKCTKHVPIGIDLKTFFEFCIFHKLENIAYLALKGTMVHELNEEVWHKFEEKYNQAVLCDATYGYYLDIIKDAFDENGIDYLVLKGMVLKQMYPSSDMRQIADIDIYVGEECAEKARDVMLGLGFECTNFLVTSSSDNYEMGMYSQIELHRRLITNECDWKAECNSIPGRAVRKCGHELKMTDEDFYVFMICHMAKHAKFGGIGLRAVLDVWVYIRCLNELNWAEINETIARCNLTEFNNNVLKLVDYWFEGKPVEEKIKHMGAYMGLSGWNGTETQWTAGSLGTYTGKRNSKTMAKFRMYISTVFWNRERMTPKYPILEKLPFLLPFCWIHRTVNAFFNKRELTKEILTQYDSVDMDKAKMLNEFKKSIGV